MSDRLIGFLDEVLQRHFGTTLAACARMHRPEFERLLTDDGQVRLDHARRAALDWGHGETSGGVEITAERLVVTPRGLMYAAELRAPKDTLLYLATPAALFESFADRAHAAESLQGSAAAVDSRLGHDLTFPWPLDRALLRTFDDYEVLHVVQ